MQVIDNDMDGLFREAAENYPLRVSSADWSKVQAGLSVTNSPIPAQEKKRNKNWLWLLLFLLIPLMCNQLHFNSADKNISANMQLAKTEKSTKNNAMPPLPSTKNLSDKGFEGDNSNIAPKNTGIVNIPTTSGVNKIIFQSTPAVYDIQTKIKELKSGAKAKIKIKNAIIFTAADLAIGTNESANESSEGEFFSSVRKYNLIGLASPGKISINRRQTLMPRTAFDLRSEEGNLAKTEKAKKATEQNKNIRQGRFYVGLVIGKDASKVKSERIDKFGLSAGVSIGYNINKHFALEVGAFYSKKYYNSDIKYFNNKKTMWPSNRIITDLEGICQMIEIPVALRYNFSVKAKHTFFASAGLSSYLMKAEDYEYNYTTSTDPNPYGVYKTYKNSGNNLLSVLQLSAGWQKKLSKVMSIKVQPYYDIPLKGLGIGKLPISGAGLQAGINFDIK